MRNKIIIVVILCILTLGFYILKNDYNLRGVINSIINENEHKTLNDKFQTKIKSGNLSTDYNINQVLIDIENLKLNTINVPIVINIDNRTSSNMSIDDESKRKCTELIKKLKGKKINIILEPYPWIENGSVGETEWNPNSIKNFFYNWEHSVLKVLIDEVAIPYHVDALNIGTSFVNMEANEKYMCGMIDYVRRYYKGLVTYRTNFWVTAVSSPELTAKYEKKLNNKLFSKLDFISIAAYFELTNNETNTVNNLVNSLECTQINDRKQNVEQEIKEFYNRWNKLIFFGELGFPKTNKASVQPYNPYLSDIANNQEQANCFEAYRRVFENYSWNLGFSVFAIGKNDLDKRYYPSKESTEIIRKWYAKVEN